jgi:peptidoglycan/LPS O-acetylase OafA/YrhL
MDWTGLHFFNRYGLYDMSNAVAVGAVVKPAADSLTLKDFVFNALFLQTIVGPTFGSNGPLWSLANEWWYYILFPALVALVFRRSVAGVITSLAIAVALVWMLPGEILLLVGVWVLGVGAAVCGNAEKLKSGNAEKADMLKSLFLVVAGVVFGGSLLVARREVLSSYWWQYLVGVAFALLLVALATYSSRLPGSRVSAYLAEFSYSVYLTHFPALMLMVSAAFTLTGYGVKVQFGAAGLVWYAVVVATAILVAWIVSMFTEAKTPALRRKIYGILRIANGR